MGFLYHPYAHMFSMAWSSYLSGAAGMVHGAAPWRALAMSHELQHDLPLSPVSTLYGLAILGYLGLQPPLRTRG